MSNIGNERLRILERAVAEWERDTKRGRRGRGRKNGTEPLCAGCPLQTDPKLLPVSKLP